MLRRPCERLRPSDADPADPAVSPRAPPVSGRHGPLPVAVSGRLSFNALAVKFLLAFVPMFLLLAGGSFWWLLHYDARHGLGELSARIGGQAARAVAALERHDALAQPPLARDLLSPLVVDPAVLCIDLLRGGGDNARRVHTGTDCEAWHDSRHALTLPVRGGVPAGLASAAGGPLDRGRAVGSLSVRFSDAEVVRQAVVRRNALLSTLLAAIVLAALCSSVGFRLVVGRRLASLSAALERIVNGGERVPVDAGSRDELGRVMQAFNEMVRREEEREDALQASLAERETARAELERVNGELQRWIRTGESERRFRDFVASASDWYWEMDADLRFSYFSDRFPEVSGVPAEALLGRTPEETGIPDVDPAAWERHLDDLRNHRAFRAFEHPRVRDGETVWLSINGTPLFDEHGEFIGYRGTGSDITERVRAKQLARQKEVSEQLARTKDEFLANMSHEIRTPINGVLGMTEVLMRTPLDDKQRRYTENVRRSAEMLLGVVNDILDFSKMQAGKMALHAVPFDLRELVEDVIEMFAPGAHGKGVELAADLHACAEGGYRADAGRLRQVLVNLVGNAVKFTREGEIVVRVSCEDGEADPPRLRFEVRDSGIGIPPEAQAYIFDSFAQADGSTTRLFGGTGLGLAISSQLVALMSGEIGVDSAPGVGSTFWFTLPLPRASVARTPAAGPQLAGRRILVVDDNATNREILVHQLAACDAAPDCAASGDEALDMLRRAAGRGEPYDLAVLDMHMERMDGLALSRAISGDAGIAGVRRLMLSSVGDSLGAEELASVGIEAALLKPVRQRDLHRCLGALFEGREPAPAGADDVQPPRTLRGRILLAEDNTVNQEVALALLAEHDLDVEVATDGHSALAAWSRSEFDLVLMDCQMPGLNGYEAARMIRRREHERGRGPVPIVALTANAMPGDRERCLGAGMDDYLSKPFSERQIREVLERWMVEERDDGEAGRRDAAAAPAGGPAPADGPVVRDSEAEPLLDESVLARYRSRRGSRGDLVRRIVDAYLAQSKEYAEALDAAVAAGDSEALRAVAHPLKSSSAQVGAMKLSRLCAVLEQSAREGLLDGLDGTLHEFRDMYPKVCEALERHCEEAAA